MGLLGAVWWSKRSQRREAAETAARAHDAFIAGRHGEAFSLFASAAAQAPLNPAFQKSAARAAFAADRRPEAITYAKRAWELGLHDEEVLVLLLLDAGQGDRAAVLARGEELINGLPEGVQRQRMRGRLYGEFGREDEALEAFRSALATEPDPLTIADYATLLAKRQETELLYTELQRWRSARLLNATGYRLLALAAAYRRQERGASEAEDPLAIIAEAIDRQCADPALRVDQALHLCNRLRFSEALQVVSQVLEPAQRRDVGLITIWCLIDTNAQESLRAMLDRPAEPGPVGEGLHLVMQAMARPARDPQERLLDLARAERLLGAHAILRLFSARLHIEAREFDLALRMYQAVSGLLAATPTVLVEQASVLAILGRRDAALAMVLDLHRLHGSTRRSLLLLGQLSRSGDAALADAVRNALASAPAEDADLRALAVSLGTSGPMGPTEIGGTAADELDGNQRAAVEAVRRLIDDGEAAKALIIADKLGEPAAVREAWRGLALHSLGRHEEALAAFATSRSTEQPVLIDVREAASALLLKRLDVAEEAIRRGLGKTPSNLDCRRIQALILLESGDARGALRNLDEAGGDRHELDPVRALALAQAGDQEAALKISQAALQRNAGDVVAANLAADLLLAAGRAQEAVATLGAALRLHPDEPAILRRIAAAQLAIGDATSARQALDLLVELRPRDAGAAVQRVRVLALTGDLRAAQQAIDRLPPTATMTDRALLASLVQRCSGRPAAAIELLTPLLADPAIAEQWALLVLESGDPRPLAPVFVPLKLDLGRWLRLGFAAEQAGRWSDAAELMRLARVQHGDDTALLNNWAWYSMHVPGSDGKQVLETARAAWARAPQDPSLTDTWCEVLLAAGKSDECLSALRGLPTALQDEPQFLHHRGRALEQRGDQRAAREAFVRARDEAAKRTPWPLRETRESLTQRIEAMAP